MELKVRSLGEEAVVGWRGCRSELLRSGKQDEVGWVLGMLEALGADWEGSHPSRETEAEVWDGRAEPEGVHLC